MVIGTPHAMAAKPIVHDAEYYILEAQNGKVWEVEDGQLDQKIAELRKKFGAPPNIIHYMWDDQPVMAFGDPMFQQIRGYSTPELNKLASDGMIFSRMCTEPSRTVNREPLPLPSARICEDLRVTLPSSSPYAWQSPLAKTVNR